jgi:hypothetical protein
MAESEGAAFPWRRFLWPAIAAALGLTAVFAIIGRPLQTAVAPGGILSFEFAATPGRAAAIVASWDRQTQVLAGLNLGLDFLYPPLYAAAVSLSCLAAANHYPPSLRRLGSWLATAVWIAALLDYVENIALIQLLFGAAGPLWAPLAAACAGLKFAILGVAILYALIGAAGSLIRR